MFNWRVISGYHAGLGLIPGGFLKEETFESVEARLLQTRCRFCHPNNSVKALK